MFSPHQIYWLIPLALGAIVFANVVGIQALRWEHVEWLLHGDPLQHFIGWVFYRQTPWDFPLGANPAYGLEIGSSIVYSDSIPILAMIFKAFLSWNTVNPPVQYFGFWLLLCFMLQGLAAWHLMGLISPRVWIRSVGVLPFLFAVPLLGRLAGNTTHYALAGQFLILFALYLNLRPQDRFPMAAWIVLLGAALGIHFYLFVMVGAIWVASVVQHARLYPCDRVKVSVGAFLTIGLMAALAWQLGYFMVNASTSSIEGFGYHALNLVSPVNAKGWSAIWPTLPVTHETGEDLNFLGLGILGLLPLALWQIGRRWSESARLFKRHIELVITLGVLSAFAISNQVAVGALMVSMPLPPSLEWAVALVRSSVRLFWPMFYFLLFLVLYASVRLCSPRLWLMLATPLFISQIVDSYPMWKKIYQGERGLETPAWSEKLPSSFWSQAAQRYQRVSRYPLDTLQMQPHWGLFSQYAAYYRLGTNIVYLARVDAQKASQYNDHFQAQVNAQRIATDSMVIIPEHRLPWLISRVGAQAIRHIDGFYVWSPQGFWDASGEAIRSEALFPPIQNQQAILFSSAFPAHRIFLSQGWSHQEPWGVWSTEQSAELLFPLSSARAQSVTMQLQLFNPQQQPKVLRIQLDEQPLVSLTISNDQPLQIQIPIPKGNLASEFLRIRFDTPQLERPKPLAAQSDLRTLGLGLLSVQFNHAR